jgi:F420-dependent oxidoreductase-like protein
MIELALMIEGQEGVNWPRWQRLCRAVEDLGFAGLYRSDHFTTQAPEEDSLELWPSLTWAASHTSRIEFGPLVAPVSFRNPAVMARTAAAIDDLSGGRLQLGMGAGWNEREHHMFGFDLLETKPRFERFAEGLEVVTRLLRSDTPVSFEGSYYQLREAILLPRPTRPGGPPIVIGGNGPKLTLPLAARFADEWNGVFVGPARFAELSARLDELARQQGRAPESIRRTLMNRAVLARSPEELERRTRGQDVAALRERGVLIGTVAEIAERLGEYEAAGVQRIMLQWLELDDLEGIEALAKGLID